MEEGSAKKAGGGNFFADGGNGVLRCLAVAGLAGGEGCAGTDTDRHWGVQAGRRAGRQSLGVEEPLQRVLERAMGRASRRRIGWRGLGSMAAVWCCCGDVVGQTAI